MLRNFWNVIKILHVVVARSNIKLIHVLLTMHVLDWSICTEYVSCVIPSNVCSSKYSISDTKMPCKVVF